LLLELILMGKGNTVDYKYLALCTLYIAIGLIIAGIAVGIVGKYIPALVGGTATTTA
jgi:hypothetical protein